MGGEGRGEEAVSLKLGRCMERRPFTNIAKN
jgi:hypothetical protein